METIGTASCSEVLLLHLRTTHAKSAHGPAKRSLSEQELPGANGQEPHARNLAP